MSDGALYHGAVIHRRLRPRGHVLRYQVFSLLADLDALPHLARTIPLFSYNRFNLFSFHDKDHGPGDGSPLRPWVVAQLAAAGIDLGGGTVSCLCYPRILGYTFNPLTVYFCRYPDGRLAATLYEVSNTFGQRHTYVIPVGDPEARPVRQSCPKRFYVSPFLGVEGRYDFIVTPPDAQVAVVIHESDAEGRVLEASFVGRRGPLTGWSLARAFVRYPLMTVKVIAGIHWEAFRLWRKQTPLHRRPPQPPASPVTIVTAESSAPSHGG